MERNKVKLLSNFQLFQLAQNELLDKETRAKARQEFTSRNISTIEIEELKRQHSTSFDLSKKELDANYWDPFYTAFEWKRHFKHVALLRTQGHKADADRYQIRFYFGLFMYMLIFVCVLLLFSK